MILDKTWHGLDLAAASAQVHMRIMLRQLAGCRSRQYRSCWQTCPHLRRPWLHPQYCQVAVRHLREWPEDPLAAGSSQLPDKAVL